MDQKLDSVSPSGVRIAADFRDNLIIDRYDPLFIGMRASKRSYMCSENSEDAVTWNVFRTLRQIGPQAWLPTLFAAGLPSESPRSEADLAVLVWKSVPPPPALVVEIDEGASEIDVVLETSSWVWFIEAKYQSDISIRTSNRPLRDQLLRNIDVGSYYAGVRHFFFSLLISSPKRSPKGVEAIHRYSDLQEPLQLLREHRPDGLSNLRAVTLLTWQDLGKTLRNARDTTMREDERGYASRALEWLDRKGLLPAAG